MSRKIIFVFISICMLGCSSDNPTDSEQNSDGSNPFAGIWEGISVGAEQGPTQDSVIYLQQNVHFEFDDDTFAYAGLRGDLSFFGADGSGNYQFNDTTITLSLMISRSLFPPLVVYGEFNYQFAVDTLFLTKPIEETLKKPAYVITLTKSKDKNSCFALLPPEPELLNEGWYGFSLHLFRDIDDQFDLSLDTISFYFDNGKFYYYFGYMFDNDPYPVPPSLSGVGDYRIHYDTMYFLNIDTYDSDTGIANPDKRFLFDIVDSTLTLNRLDLKYPTISHNYVLDKVDGSWK